MASASHMHFDWGVQTCNQLLLAIMYCKFMFLLVAVDKFAEWNQYYGMLKYMIHAW